MTPHKRRPKRRHSTSSIPNQALPPAKWPAEFEPVNHPVPVWRHLVGGTLILFICILAYSNNLHGKLVLDDRSILAGNEYIRSLKNIPQLFKMNWWAMTPERGAGSVYRPMAAASYAFDVFIMGGHKSELEAKDPYSGGLDVRVLHATSLACHFMASLLVYSVLLNLLQTNYRIVFALFGALLFAAHPVHVEAVSGHVGRAEVLSGMFFFGATAAFIYGNRLRDRLSWTILAAILWLAALLAKEMAVTLPGLLVLFGIFQGRKRTLGRWMALSSPLLVAGMIYFLLRHSALGAETGMSNYEALPLSTVSYGDRLLTMTHAVAWYWILLMVPVSMSADYSGFPVTRALDSPVFCGGMLVLGVTLVMAAYGFRVRRQTGRAWLGVVAFGVLAVYLLLLPVSNLFLNTGVVVSERALYIPSLGLVIATAAVLQKAWVTAKGASRRLILAGLAGLLVSLGVIGCRLQNRVWFDERTLFSAAVTHRYCGHIGFSGMSAVLIGEGNYQQALEYANRSFAQRPTEDNLTRQANCLMGLERYSEAIKPLEILVRNKIHESVNLQKLANCYLRAGRTEDARSLVELHPEIASDPQLAPLRRAETRLPP